METYFKAVLVAVLSGAAAFAYLAIAAFDHLRTRLLRELDAELSRQGGKHPRAQEAIRRLL